MEIQSNDSAKKQTGQFVIHEDVAQSLPSKHVPENLSAIRCPNTPIEGVAIPLVTSRLTNQQSHFAQNVGPCPPKEKPLMEMPSIGSSSISVTPSTLEVSNTLQLPGEKSVSENVQTASPSLTKSEELSRLKLELEAAKDQIAKMDAELSLSKIAKHTVDQALGSPIYGTQDSTSGESRCSLNHVSGNISSYESDMPDIPAFLPRSDDALDVQGPPYNEWSQPSASGFNGNTDPTELWTRKPTPIWLGQHSDFNKAPSQAPACPQPQRLGNIRRENVVASSMPYTMATSGSPWNSSFRSTAHVAPNRPGSALSHYLAELDSFPSGMANPMDCSPPITPTHFHSGVFAPRGTQFHPSGLKTSQSPVASSFGAGSMVSSNPWNSQPHFASNSSTFVTTTEPMNYRRLLDRNTSCNWKYIVEKIVCSNDQQASIFLQQKLKVATAEQKHELIQAIIDQAYPLMVNRFGNFLVQRCFEHGTPEQVSAIANVIQGNVLNLSMDAFGCHVIQKAFDVVPENYKAIMVHELLRRIPETVIHRYACHVWQKLFELRWSDAPPQIMKHVNEALRGMWHEVALGETGSLVVQNIFENCLEEDKRPCVSEVLSNIDLISHGQFGNWCIQHICEHGAPADKSRAIEHVLQFATEYSTDQYASKVVEKCLKVGGPEFLERYLERVCEGRPDRPRMPLIDIAGDQYGNYLVQYILMNASPQHREVVANHIRKHMVSLRGSKFGSRVAMACSNPALATRPGPPTGFGLSTARFNTGVLSRTGPGAHFR